jgi:hypothetical protein
MNHVILFGVSFKGNAVELIRSSVFWVGYNNAWNQNQNENDGVLKGRVSNCCQIINARSFGDVRSKKMNGTMTFMIAWSVERAHFKVTISRFPLNWCRPAGGRHAVGPMAFPNHLQTEA